MTFLQVAPPATIVQWNGYIITQTGMDVSDKFAVQGILRQAANNGVSIIQDGVGAAVPPDSAPDPQTWEYDWANRPPSVLDGPYTVSVAGGMSLGRYGIAYNQPPGQNNEWRWRIPVSRGTWRMDLTHDGDPSRCITTWEISYDNGSSWSLIGAIDQYRSTANVQNIQDTLTFTCPFTGVALLRLRNPTKNALGGWYWTVSLLRLTRTA